MKWHVVIVGINQEALALRGLISKGLDAYCPVGKRIIRHARKEIKKTFPVFSRYIFVRFHDYSVASDPIRSTDGVLDILSNNWIPMEVPAWAIDDIKTREAKGEFDVLPSKVKRPRWAKSFEILKNMLEPDAAIQV
jgi:transcriptional antiterminator RfaH